MLDRCRRSLAMTADAGECHYTAAQQLRCVGPEVAVSLNLLLHWLTATYSSGPRRIVERTVIATMQAIVWAPHLWAPTTDRRRSVPPDAAARTVSQGWQLRLITGYNNRLRYNLEKLVTLVTEVVTKLLFIHLYAARTWTHNDFVTYTRTAFVCYMLVTLTLVTICVTVSPGYTSVT